MVCGFPVTWLTSQRLTVTYFEPPKMSNVADIDDSFLKVQRFISLPKEVILRLYVDGTLYELTWSCSRLENIIRFLFSFRETTSF